MIVIDASVVVEFLAPDAAETGATHQLFERWSDAGEELHAPAMLAVEVRNALLTGVRRQRWDGAAADAASRLAVALPIVTHDIARDLDAAWELARRHDNYPIYDMLYVALAQRIGEPLVTLDDRLRRRLAHLGWVLRPDEILTAAASEPDDPGAEGGR